MKGGTRICGLDLDGSCGRVDWDRFRLGRRDAVRRPGLRVLLCAARRRRHVAVFAGEGDAVGEGGERMRFAGRRGRAITLAVAIVRAVVARFPLRRSSGGGGSGGGVVGVVVLGRLGWALRLAAGRPWRGGSLGSGHVRWREEIVLAGRVI